MDRFEKPVIGIDLGATYTKVSWRPKWPGGNNYYQESSNVISIDGEKITPTVVFETGDKDFYFGKEAAQLKPGEGDIVYSQWKEDLFSAESSEAAIVAGKFLGWIRKKLEEEGDLPVDEARWQICVPEFNEVEVEGKLSLLSQTMEENGWNGSEITRASEPAANASGLLTQGRNHANFRGDDNFDIVYGSMLGNGSPLIRAARLHALAGARANHKLAIVDFGSFTTDVAIMPWNADGNDHFLGRTTFEESFKHGIINQLDRVVFDEIGSLHEIQFDRLSFTEREEIKKCLYNRKPYRLENQSGAGFVTLGGPPDLRTVKSSISDFVDSLWSDHLKEIVASESLDWVIFTGGGTRIKALLQRLSEKFLEAGVRPISSETDSEEFPRLATAIGSSSVILDFRETPEKQSQQSGESRKVSPSDDGLVLCTCKANPMCMRCGGKGTYKRREVSRATVSVRQVAPATVPKRPSVEAAPKPETVKRTPRQARKINSVDESEIQRIIENEQGEMLADFTLAGWMGDLVFAESGGNVVLENEAILDRLKSADSEIRNRSWYRLLCLGCLFGAPVKTSVIRTFWAEILDRNDFWRITEAEDGFCFRQNRVDQMFEDLIHREFRSLNASGEHAELLRRVFYDFRKMHHYVYQNELPQVLLEVFATANHWEEPLRFLKSGHLPDSKPWRGVIGQSMTAPLLFLMREFCRIGLIDKEEYGPVSFYMNGPARRAAARLEWIDPTQINQYHFDALIDTSGQIYEKVKQSAPNMLDWYDLPLQMISK